MNIRINEAMGMVMVMGNISDNTNTTGEVLSTCETQPARHLWHVWSVFASTAVAVTISGVVFVALFANTAFAEPDIPFEADRERVSSHLTIGLSLLANPVIMGMGIASGSSYVYIPDMVYHLEGVTLVNKRHEFRYGGSYRLFLLDRFLGLAIASVGNDYSQINHGVGLEGAYLYRPVSRFGFGPAARYYVDLTDRGNMTGMPYIMGYSAGGQARWYASNNNYSFFFSTMFTQYMEGQEILLWTVESNLGVSIKFAKLPFLSSN